MRNRLILLSLGILIAGCSDGDSVTSPTTADSDTPIVAAIAPASGGANGKPVDQVGFTRVQVLYGSAIEVGPGQAGVAQAVCPAGTVPTGGGHEATLVQSGPTPHVWRSRPLAPGLNGGGGWSIAVENQAPGAVNLYIQAWVLCAS